jgi:hypothetical protein
VSERPDCRMQRAFLLRAYFGAEGDPTGWFISRAYLDVCRTLHRLSKEPNAKKLVKNANQSVRGSLCKLKRQGVPTNAGRLVNRFDEWHRAACNELIGCFADFKCHYGQAQKWINMTIKYDWFFSPTSELNAWFSVAHMPVDGFVLRAAYKRAVIKRSGVAWSRWDHQSYEAFQSSIRDHAVKLGKTPLAIEHAWWMEESER